MTQLHCLLPDITVTRPKGLSRRIFFHVYSGANAVAFAHLSSASKHHQSRPAFQSNESGTQAPGISYCLRNIEVSQNYRNRGIGTALLDEIISFCQDERISSLYGEAKGDVDTLRRWYQGKGFRLDSVDNIRLSL